MNCIICDKENTCKIVEHIVSESFGNKKYIIELGAVCDSCNSLFSGFESKAMNNTILAFERARLGIPTKKGHTVKGQINKLKLEGDKEFTPNIINIKGLQNENIRNYDTQKETFEIVVPTFHKTEVPTSKLLLKIGIESFFQSQRTIFNSFDFSEIKEYLCNKNNKDWPFLISDFEFDKYKWIPNHIDNKKLLEIRCELKYTIYKNNLIFKFKYGAVSMKISLLNRELNWIAEVLNNDSKAVLYPEHFIKDLKKL